MFVELILVAAIILVLNFFGVGNLTSITGVLVSAGLAVGSVFLFVLTVRFLASYVSEEFFNFSSWSGAKAPVPGKDIPPKVPRDASLDFLRKRAALWPKDLGASRDLAEAFVKNGYHELAIRERQRYLALAGDQLTVEEYTTVVYRIADSHQVQGRVEEAAQILGLIQKKWPSSSQADFAQQRIDNLLGNQVSPQIVSH